MPMPPIRFDWSIRLGDIGAVLIVALTALVAVVHFTDAMQNVASTMVEVKQELHRHDERIRTVEQETAELKGLTAGVGRGG